jgi:predicted dehydrogenase
MSYQRDFEKRLRIGVVGVGSHAYRNILPTLHHLPIQLQALCDTNLDLARRTAPEYGVKNCYATLTEMIAGETLDAVFLCTGEKYHPRLACEAFDAGLHVWMEKPVARRAAEVEEMIRHRGNRVGVVGIKKAFMPATDKAVELFTDGKYGPIRTILGVYPINIPEDGAAALVADQGNPWLANSSHPLGFMVAVGGAVRSVTTYRGRHGGGIVVLDYANGALGNLHLASGGHSSQPLESYLVIGHGAQLTVDNVNRVTLQRGVPFEYGKTTRFVSAGEETGAVVWEPQNTLGTLENKTEFTHGMVGEMMHFCESVLAAVPATRGTLEIALHLMRIYEAALLSQGQPVFISDSP